MNPDVSGLFVGQILRLRLRMTKDENKYRTRNVLFSSCCGNSICHSRESGNPAFSPWTPAPRFRGDKFTPAEAGAGATSSIFVFRHRYYLETLSAMCQALRASRLEVSFDEAGIDFIFDEKIV